MTALAEAPARRRQVFHPLRVAAVDRLCDDAVAVTFAVPDELADRYAFRPGQSLTLRRTVDGRQSAGRTRSAPPPARRRGSASGRWPDGLFSSWLVRARPARRRDRGGAADRLVHARPGPERPPRAHRRRLRHHPGAVDRARRPRRPGRQRHPALRQPPQRHGDVRRRAGRPQGRAPRPARAGARAVPGGAGGRPAHRPARPGQGPRPAGGRGRARPTSSTGGCAGRTRWSSGIRQVLAEAGVPAERVHTELFFVEDTPPEQARHDELAVDGPTSTVTVVLDGRSSS